MLSAASLFVLFLRLKKDAEKYWNRLTADCYKHAYVLHKRVTALNKHTPVITVYVWAVAVETITYSNRCVNVLVICTSLHVPCVDNESDWFANTQNTRSSDSGSHWGTISNIFTGKNTGWLWTFIRGVIQTQHMSACSKGCYESVAVFPPLSYARITCTSFKLMCVCVYICSSRSTLISVLVWLCFCEFQHARSYCFEFFSHVLDLTCLLFDVFLESACVVCH